MTTRDNSNLNLDHHGIISETKFCKGPFISTCMGLDHPCCMSCDNVRNCARRDELFFSSTSPMYEIYVEQLKKLKFETESSYTLTTCGSKKLFIRKYNNKEPELQVGSFIGCFIEQIHILRDMGFVFYQPITNKSLSYTKIGIPIYFPDFDNYNPPEMNQNASEILTRNSEKILKVLNKDKILRDRNFSTEYIISSYFGLDAGLEDGRQLYYIPNLKPQIKTVVQFDKYENSTLKAPGKKTDKYVILDLDSTLIYSDSIKLNQEIKDIDGSFVTFLSVRTDFMRTKIRSYLSKFLDDLRKEGYKIIVWSAGCESYVKTIVSVIFKHEDPFYVFTYDHVEKQTCKKKLHLISNYIENFNIENSRLIDDAYQIHAKDQEKYFIHIPEFLGSDSDNVLENFIETVKNSFA